MSEDEYSAKEAMGRLKLPTTTFYRKVKEGHIPYKGRRPHMRFPKEAIDAIAEIDSEDETVDELLFKLSTRADIWTKREIIKQTYGVEDAVPFKTVLAWRKRNEQISMQVNKGNQILGWTTFLPLEEDLIIALIEDKMKEGDIPPEAVKKWDDQQISVYIPTLQVAETRNEERNKAIVAFLIKKTIKWALTLRVQYDIKNWYAIGTSRAGQTLLEALGFKQIISLDGGKRKGYRLDDTAKPAKLLKNFFRK
jgi:excisionase family DNA binding protein